MGVIVVPDDSLAKYTYICSAVHDVHESPMDIVDSRTQKPVTPVDGSGDATVDLYNRNLRDFGMLETTALLLIANNITMRVRASQSNQIV